MNPKNRINGREDNLICAVPPERIKSTVFIANSMAIIEIRLIPSAVFKDSQKLMPCNFNIIVSNMILVINPLIIARAMICMGCHAHPKV